MRDRNTLYAGLILASALLIGALIIAFSNTDKVAESYLIVAVGAASSVLLGSASAHQSRRCCFAKAPAKRVQNEVGS